MERLFSVSGTLDRDFIGQITYTICLEKTYTALDIAFSFEKRRFAPEDVTRGRMDEVRALCLEKYGMNVSDEQARGILLDDMKTEIHTLATLNGEFIGCVHKQLETRHMRYDGDDVTDGCIPQPSFSGVLQVTLLAFNVIKDGTRYSLAVYAAQGEQHVQAI